MWCELARQDLNFYGEYVLKTDTGQPLIPANHHKVINAALMDESIDKLLIIAPPGCAKTTWTALAYVSWYTGNNPDDNVILTSVTATQASLRSVAVRDTITDNEKYKQVFPNVQPDKKKGWGEAEWFIKRSDPSQIDATMAAAGVCGPIIGRRADLIVVDDPHDEVNSATKGQRDKVKRWYGRTLMSRLRPGGRVVVIMTRWHEDDLAADLIAKGYTVVHLPAIFKEDNPVNQTTKGYMDAVGASWQVGDVLWPEVYTHEVLADKKKDLGSILFEGMYQGNPRLAEGNYFKRAWFKYFAETATHYILYQHDGSKKQILKELCWRFQTCDPAASTKEAADFFVIGTWAVTPDRELLLLDVLRGKFEGPDQPKMITQQYRKHAPGYIRIEKVAYQLTLFQTVVRQGLPARPDLTQGKDKLSKALVASARYEAGTIYHRHNAEWVYDWEEELLGFDTAAHDDQVDNASMAAAEVAAMEGKQQDILGW